jgi:hypothetical protein
MTGTNRDLFTHNYSRSYLNHLVIHVLIAIPPFSILRYSSFPLLFVTETGCVYSAVRTGRLSKEITCFHSQRL